MSQLSLREAGWTQKKPRSRDSESLPLIVTIQVYNVQLEVFGLHDTASSFNHTITMAAMRMPTLLLLCLAISLEVYSSRLPIGDIRRLLEEDWSVIAEVTAKHENPSSSQAAPQGGYVGLSTAPQHGLFPVRASESNDLGTSALVTPLPAQASSQVTTPLATVTRVPVQVPLDLPVLQISQRIQELKGLSLLFRTAKDNVLMKPRRVLPLQTHVLSSETYKIYYEFYLNHPFRKRLLWTPNEVTYMLYKPIRRNEALVRLFGGFFAKHEIVWAVWRQEMYGEAKVWRLLGLLEMPSRQPAQRFIDTYMQEMSPPHASPLVFFNDGAHLDPSQAPMQKV